MGASTGFECKPNTRASLLSSSVHTQSTASDDSIESDDRAAHSPANNDGLPSARSVLATDVPSLLRMMRYHNTHRNRTREHYLATRRLFFAHRALLTQPRNIHHHLTQYVCEQAMDAMIALHATDHHYNTQSYQHERETDADEHREDSSSSGGGWQCGWLDAIKCYCYLHSRGMGGSGIGFYNRLLECLLRADQDDDKGHSSQQRATAAAPWLEAARSHLQRMDDKRISHNPYTHYLLALANLRRGEKQAAYQQLQALSDLTRHGHSTASLTAHQWRALFYAFARVRDSEACTLIVEDMERTGGRPSSGMKDAIAKMKEPITAPAAVSRASIHQSHPTSTPDNTAFDLHSPLPRAPAQLNEAIVRPLDVVDPVPPALDDTLGSYLADYQQLIADQPSQAGDTTEASLVAYLRQCCASEDAEGAVQCWLTLRADGRETSSATALHFLLSVFCTANFATAASVSSLSSPLMFVRYAERLHIQLQHALSVLDTLQSASLPLPQPLAILMLRALAYLPMPLPSAGSSALNLASSSYFASLPVAVFLTAEEAASRCLTLYQLCLPSPPSLPSADSIALRTRLQSLLVRAHIKHRQLGRQLNDSLLSAEEGATHTPLDADACAYLIYHHINLPTPSIEAAYNLFSHLLPSQSAAADTPPPLLAVYYLSCGELMRRNASKARLMVRECLNRWSMAPSSWLLDAVVLSVGGHGMSGVDEQKEEDDTALLLHELCTRSGAAAVPLPLSLEAITVWCERRVGRWLRVKQVDSALDERVRVDREVAEAIVRSILHPSSSSTSVAPVTSSAVPLSLLTNLLVMMSTSPMLEDVLLAVVQRVLVNDEYLSHNASDSAVVSALHSEAEWYGLSRTLSQPAAIQALPIESSATLTQFARFKAALTSRSSNSPSQSAFLRRHTLSRIVRCIVYSFSYTTPPSAVLLFLTSLSHRLRLDLDGYALHLLLFVSSTRLLPNSQQLYRMALTASSRHDDEEYGYEAASSSVWSRTLQYSHLFYLLYVTRVYGRSSPESRHEFNRLLARLLDYRVDPQQRQPLAPPIVISGFLTDDVVWTLLDLSLLVSSPSALQQAVSALLLQDVPHVANPIFPIGAATAQGVCPLPRFATTLMRGYLLAARGVHSKGWIHSGTRLAMSWAIMYELCHRYFASHTGLISNNGKQGIFLVTQRDLLCRLAALSVDHNNLQPVMALYSTIMQLTAESPAAAQQLIHLPLFVVPIKAALLNGHKRKLSAVVKDLLAWDGLQRVTDEQVRTELTRCRLGVLDASSMSATTKSMQGVVRTLISRTNIVSQRVYLTTPQQPHTRQWEEEAEDRDSSSISSAPTASALSAAVGAYRAVLSSRLLLTDTGLQFASQLFSDMYYAHVKAKRQQAEKLQKELHGEEGDEQRMHNEDNAGENESAAEDVDEAADEDDAAQLQHLLYDDVGIDRGESEQANEADDVQSWATLSPGELHMWSVEDTQLDSRATAQAAEQKSPTAPTAEESRESVRWTDRQPMDIPRVVEQLCDECVVSMVGHARALVSSSDYQRALEEHKRIMIVRIAQLRKQQQQEGAWRAELPRQKSGQRDRQRERDKVMSMLGRRSSQPVVAASNQSQPASIDKTSKLNREQQHSRLPVAA